ncbi:MAG TPA: filamentous hemagglutinin N-terminal domain-containing protein [Candidatus Obscuribacterales bacterium]
MMKLWARRLWQVKVSTLFCLVPCLPTVAQIVPDATLPVNSIVTPQGNTSLIEGGSRAGNNLFHSFTQFSVPTGETAFFNNALDIQNIFSRVTGGTVSNIDGLLQTSGTANLFLLNPNGIIFGANASLNIGGSFIASTATSVNFADGSELGTTNTQTPPMLTVSVPVGLGFGSTPGQIRVQGDGQGIRQTPDLIDNTAGLRVQPNQTLALVGGDLVLEGATLKTAGGRIELGSVTAPGLVSLTPSSKGFTLGYEGVPAYGNIQLSQQAAVDASGEGGGDVQLWGSQIKLSDGSQIEASTLGSEPGGTLSVNASESVEVVGTSSDGFFNSGLLTLVYPETTGAGGNLNITTGRLSVRDGAQIATATLGAGPAGKLEVKASELVEVIGTTADGLFPSVLSTTSVAPEDTAIGGNLTIETGRLIVRDGAQIAAATLGAAPAGSLEVKASESVELIGISADGFINSGLFTSVQPGAAGAGGNLTIETGQLSVRDGAQVAASTFGSGAGGNLQVNASDSVELSGISADGQFPSGLFTDVFDPEATGNGGKLTVETGQLTIRDRAEVNVSSIGKGETGDITINSRTALNAHNGKISASATQSGGGKIAINANDIRLRNSSQISTSVAQSTGGGGNIEINSGTLIALEDSDVLATAFQGSGGRITISSPVFLADIFANGGTGIVSDNTDVTLFPGNNRVDISASSQFGSAGVVAAPDFTFLQNSLSSLSANFVSSEQAVAGSCIGRRTRERGSFTVTGTGGLAVTPYDETINGWYPLPREGVQNPSASVPPATTGAVVQGRSAGVPPVSSGASSPNWKPGDNIVEAQGIVVLADGRTILGSIPTRVQIANAQSLVCHKD